MPNSRMTRCLKSPFFVVDLEKLEARQLTLMDVRNVLQAQNKDTSVGDFWEGKRRWVARAKGQFRNLEQVEHQLLTICKRTLLFA